MARIGDDLIIRPDGKDVAVNRLRFLAAERTEPGRVRRPIMASWRRSRELCVAADRIELSYQGNIDIDTPLTRSAEPVLRCLHAQLSGQSVSIILSDRAGRVLTRRTADVQLERHLDSVRLAPGFSYAEEFVGTNGIGTALEARSPIEVFGHEHYADNLVALAGAGVPIHDPISGCVLGILELICWRQDAQSLLLPLATATAEQIQHALLISSGLREFEVLQAYRQTCRRTTGIVFALTGDVVMLNTHAQAALEPGDQATLLAHAGDPASGLAPGRRHSRAVMLPSGAAARMYCQQVGSGADEPSGMVVRVEMEPGPTPSRSSGTPTRMLLPGLIGDAPLWQRACHQVERTRTDGTWLALEGDAGSASSYCCWPSSFTSSHRVAALFSTPPSPATIGSGWPRCAAPSPRSTRSSSPTSINSTRRGYAGCAPRWTRRNVTRNGCRCGWR